MSDCQYLADYCEMDEYSVCRHPMNANMRHGGVCLEDELKAADDVAARGDAKTVIEIPMDRYINLLTYHRTLAKEIRDENISAQNRRRAQVQLGRKVRGL
jgi:hypothetical protein